MPFLILLRHGQSTWNLENRFTGWEDVDLTPQGEWEARRAAMLMKQYVPDLAYSSEMIRAEHTLAIILSELGIQIPIVETPKLIERNYGDLQGLNKADTEKKYGSQQVLSWRRSYNTAPPRGESLKDTVRRVVAYYKMEVERHLKEEKNILIVAHGNSLRALMMYLEGISEDAIADTTIATGVPRLYEFSSDLELLRVHYLEE
ncbi:2,3-diphosphoglycerate-dependent phosphoglycerate mutase [soil metagenome]